MVIDSAIQMKDKHYKQFGFDAYMILVTADIFGITNQSLLIMYIRIHKFYQLGIIFKMAAE